jgi:hemerythrin-like domain-containing protein
MALIHNIILRGLNCIYLQAPNIRSPSDIQDFMSFCDAWSCTLHSHHKTEETVYLPLLEEQCQEKGVQARNHAEHETFLQGLLVFDVFVAEVRDNGEYDGTKLVKLIDSFGRALETHLTNEIELLLSLEKDAQIDWDLLGKTMAQHSKKVADRVRRK